MEELEVSIQEKNDIIQRLSSELEKVGREMDQMGVKLQEVQNNNLAEYSMVDQLKQLQETIRLQDQKLAHKVRFQSIFRVKSRVDDPKFKSGRNKVGCVFPMIVVSILPNAEFWPNDHREDASVQHYGSRHTDLTHANKLSGNLKTIKKQEETRMLEMTIGTLERENVARQNQTNSFDLRNLERNLFQITWTTFI